LNELHLLEASQDSKLPLLLRMTVKTLKMVKSGSLSAGPDSSRNVDIEIIKKYKKRPSFGKVILVERRRVLVIYRQKSPVAFRRI
jgi:hypothetical protein